LLESAWGIQAHRTDVAQLEHVYAESAAYDVLQVNNWNNQQNQLDNNLKNQVRSCMMLTAIPAASSSQ
jgi:hypothetical protein